MNDPQTIGTKPSAASRSTSSMTPGNPVHVDASGSSQADEKKSSLKQQAGRAVHDAKDSFDTQRKEMRDKAEQAKHAAAAKAREASQYVKNKSSQAVQARQAKASEHLKTYAEAMDGVSEKLRENSDPRIAELADSAGKKLHKSADYLKETDPGAMAEDVRGLARQYPELVFGGLFVLGLAAARFLKASDDHDQTTESPNSKRSAGASYSSGVGARSASGSSSNISNTPSYSSR